MRKLLLISAAVAALVAAEPRLASAYTYSVYVLPQPGLPMKLLCSGLVRNTANEAVIACLKPAVGDMTGSLIARSYCNPYQSRWKTLHKDGTTPQWVENWRWGSTTNGC